MIIIWQLIFPKYCVISCTNNAEYHLAVKFKKIHFHQLFYGKTFMNSFVLCNMEYDLTSLKIKNVSVELRSFTQIKVFSKNIEYGNNKMV